MIASGTGSMNMASTESRRSPGDEPAEVSRSLATSQLQRSPGDHREMNGRYDAIPHAKPGFNGVPEITGR